MLHIVKNYVSMSGFGAQNKAKTVFKTLFLNSKVIYFFHFDNVAAAVEWSRLISRKMHFTKTNL